MIEESIIPFEVVSKETGQTIDLAMESLILTGKIIPVGAYLTVEHSFVCNEKKPVEVIYSFGLPREATLRRFKVKGQDFLIESELKSRNEVDRIYEDAIEKGQLAIKAQRYRDGIVNLTVGNVRPQEEVKVFLEMLAGIDLRDNGFRFRFPFTLSPSYHRNARVSEIDAGAGEIELPEDQFGDVFLPIYRKDPPYLHSIAFNVSIEMKGEIFLEVSSPSHPLRVKKVNSNITSVSLSTEKEIPNRDLVIDVKTKGPLNYTSGEKDSKGNIHFCAVYPSTIFESFKATKPTTNVVFVIDRSGSMGGIPMEQAKRGAKACLTGLDEGDRFTMVAFDSSIDVLSDILLPAGKENIKKAMEFIDRIYARGGTELLEAIKKSSEILKRSEVKEGNIFVITDGQVYGTEDITKGAKATNTKIHCLGIGSASQDRFLNLLAKETSGLSVFITPKERIETEALKLFSSIKTSIAKITGYTFKGLRDVKAEPDFKGVIYKGKPIVIFGETSQPGTGSIEVEILEDGNKQVKELPLKFEIKSSSSFIKLLKGAKIIDDIESNIASFEEGNLESEKLLKQLKLKSTEYGLASRAMGLVAVIKRTGDKNNDMPITKVVPVGMPDDVKWEAYFEDRLATTKVMLKPAFLQDIHTNPRAGRKVILSNQELKELSSEMIYSKIHKEDEIFELASRIEIDGGMPGKDEEERIQKSIIALLKFVEQGSDINKGPLSLHIRKLVSFLNQFAEKNELVKRILESVKKGLTIPYKACNLREGKDFWKNLKKLMTS